MRRDGQTDGARILELEAALRRALELVESERAAARAAQESAKRAWKIAAWVRPRADRP